MEVTVAAWAGSHPLSPPSGGRLQITRNQHLAEYLLGQLALVPKGRHGDLVHVVVELLWAGKIVEEIVVGSPVCLRPEGASLAVNFAPLSMVGTALPRPLVKAPDQLAPADDCCKECQRLWQPCDADDGTEPGNKAHECCGCRDRRAEGKPLGPTRIPVRQIGLVARRVVSVEHRFPDQRPGTAACLLGLWHCSSLSFGKTFRYIRILIV